MCYDIYVVYTTTLLIILKLPAVRKLHTLQCLTRGPFVGLVGRPLPCLEKRMVWDECGRLAG